MDTVLGSNHALGWSPGTLPQAHSNVDCQQQQQPQVLVQPHQPKARRNASAFYSEAQGSSLASCKAARPSSYDNMLGEAQQGLAGDGSSSGSGSSAGLLGDSPFQLNNGSISGPKPRRMAYACYDDGGCGGAPVDGIPVGGYGLGGGDGSRGNCGAGTAAAAAAVPAMLQPGGLGGLEPCMQTRQHQQPQQQLTHHGLAPCPRPKREHLEQQQTGFDSHAAAGGWTLPPPPALTNPQAPPSLARTTVASAPDSLQPLQPMAGEGEGCDGDSTDTDYGCEDVGGVPLTLPPPVSVQVSSRSRKVLDCVSGKGKLTLGVVGVFYPEIYIKGGDCIELNGKMISRGRFEKLAGSATAKWHVSIKVLPSGTTIGKWLQQQGLPVLQGQPRAKRSTKGVSKRHSSSRRPQKLKQTRTEKGQQQEQPHGPAAAAAEGDNGGASDADDGEGHEAEAAPPEEAAEHPATTGGRGGRPGGRPLHGIGGGVNTEVPGTLLATASAAAAVAASPRRRQPRRSDGAVAAAGRLGRRVGAPGGGHGEGAAAARAAPASGLGRRQHGNDTSSVRLAGGLGAALASGDGSVGAGGGGGGDSGRRGTSGGGVKFERWLEDSRLTLQPQQSHQQQLQPPQPYPERLSSQGSLLLQPGRSSLYGGGAVARGGGDSSSSLPYLPQLVHGGRGSSMHGGGGGGSSSSTPLMPLHVRGSSAATLPLQQSSRDSISGHSDHLACAPPAGRFAGQHQQHQQHQQQHQQQAAGGAALDTDFDPMLFTLLGVGDIMEDDVPACDATLARSERPHQHQHQQPQLDGSGAAGSWGPMAPQQHTMHGDGAHVPQQRAPRPDREPGAHNAMNSSGGMQRSSEGLPTARFRTGPTSSFDSPFLESQRALHHQQHYSRPEYHHHHPHTDGFAPSSFLSTHSLRPLPPSLMLGDGGVPAMPSAAAAPPLATGGRWRSSGDSGGGPATFQYAGSVCVGSSSEAAAAIQGGAIGVGGGSGILSKLSYSGSTSSNLGVPPPVGAPAGGGSTPGVFAPSGGLGSMQQAGHDRCYSNNTPVARGSSNGGFAAGMGPAAPAAAAAAAAVHTGAVPGVGSSAPGSAGIHALYGEQHRWQPTPQHQHQQSSPVAAVPTGTGTPAVAAPGECLFVRSQARQQAPVGDGAGGAYDHSPAAPQAASQPPPLWQQLAPSSGMQQQPQQPQQQQQQQQWRVRDEAAAMGTGQTSVRVSSVNGMGQQMDWEPSAKPVSTTATAAGQLPSGPSNGLPVFPTFGGCQQQEQAMLLSQRFGHIGDAAAGDGSAASMPAAGGSSSWWAGGQQQRAPQRLGVPGTPSDPWDMPYQPRQPQPQTQLPPPQISHQSPQPPPLQRHAAVAALADCPPQQHQQHHAHQHSFSWHQSQKGHSHQPQQQQVQSGSHFSAHQRQQQQEQLQQGAGLQQPCYPQQQPASEGWRPQPHHQQGQQQGQQRYSFDCGRPAVSGPAYPQSGSVPVLASSAQQQQQPYNPFPAQQGPAA